MQVPAQFEYARARSVEHAVALLTEHGPDSRVVAGGHSLLPMMKLRLAVPEWLIDLNDLEDLDFVRLEGDVLKIGAMTRHSTLLESEVAGRLFPIIHDAEKVIADPTVRNRGTMGGSLCQCDPAEDLSTVCDVLRATLVVHGPGGVRTMPVSQLHSGPYESTLSHDEVLCEVHLPVRPRSGSAYEKVERRAGDWAVAAAGAAVTLAEDGTVEDAAVGLTAVGLEGEVPGVLDVLAGQRPAEDLFAEAGRLASQACRPVADQRGPEDYKRHLAGELTRRVLRRACERAAGRTGQEG